MMHLWLSFLLLSSSLASSTLAIKDICQEVLATQNVYGALIIGAGTAGLVAADRLAQYNITDFLVIEARNRTGGRVYTITEGDDVIDLGAQFLRGTINNPVYDFALQNGLAITDAENPFREEDYYTSLGDTIPQYIADQVYHLIQQAAEDVYDNSNFDIPFGVQLKTRFEQNLASLNESFADQKRAVFRHRYNIMSANIGEDLEKENVESEIDYSADEGNLYAMVRRGYSTLLAKLSEHIPQSNIQLNSKVAQIYWNLTCPTTTASKTAVRLKNGTLLVGKMTLLTVPLGILKSGTISFIPDLPGKKASAIRNLGFGCLNKVFLKWNQQWWRGSIGNTNILWITSNPSDDPIKTNFAYYQNDTYKYWYRKSTGFNAIFGQPSILQTWFYGEWARFIEKLPEVEIQSVLMQMLRLRFDTDNFKVPDPIKIIRTNWCTDEFTGGGFTYVGMASHGTDFLALASSLPDALHPNLLFAGEATGAMAQWGTVRSAWASGILAADTIISQHGKQTR